MDEDVRPGRMPRRWVAWATAGLLAAGAVTAGAMARQNDGDEDQIVAAAGTVEGGVEVPTTVTTVFTPPLPPPPTTALPATTTTAKATTTTKAPATTTTTKAATATTVRPTTTVTVAGITLTVVNEYPRPVELTVNGVVWTLAPGQSAGPTAVPRFDHGNDIIGIKVLPFAGCGDGDADGYFATPGSYRLAVVNGLSICEGGVPGPTVRVTRT